MNLLTVSLSKGSVNYSWASQTQELKRSSWRECQNQDGPMSTDLDLLDLRWALRVWLHSMFSSSRVFWGYTLSCWCVMTFYKILFFSFCIPGGWTQGLHTKLHPSPSLFSSFQQVLSKQFPPMMGIMAEGGHAVLVRGGETRFHGFPLCSCPNCFLLHLLPLLLLSPSFCIRFELLCMYLFKNF